MQRPFSFQPYKQHARFALYEWSGMRAASISGLLFFPRPLGRSLTETDFTATIQQGSVAVPNQLAHCQYVTHPCHIAQASHPGKATCNLSGQPPRFIVGVTMVVRFANMFRVTRIKPSVSRSRVTLYP